MGEVRHALENPDSQNLMETSNVTGVNKESTRRSSNKWTNILHRDYLHRTTNFRTTILISQKNVFLTQLLKFIWNF